MEGLKKKIADNVQHVTCKMVNEYYRQMGYNVKVIFISDLIEIDEDEEEPYQYQYLVYIEQAGHITDYFNRKFGDKFPNQDIYLYNNGLKVSKEGLMGLQLFVY